jgi:hypothetical protein
MAHTRGRVCLTLATMLLMQMPTATAFAFLPLGPRVNGISSLRGSFASPYSSPKPFLSEGRNEMKQRLRGNSRLTMCSTLPEGLAMIEGIGRSLPSTWFKALGSPSTHLGLQLFFLASNAAYFLAAVRRDTCTVMNTRARTHTNTHTVCM